MRNSNQAGLARDFNPNDTFYNANCSAEDYNKMVICQNNLIEVADKCYASCENENCQLKCSEDFYESIEGQLILEAFD